MSGRAAWIDAFELFQIGWAVLSHGRRTLGSMELLHISVGSRAFPQQSACMLRGRKLTMPPLWAYSLNKDGL